MFPIGSMSLSEMNLADRSLEILADHVRHHLIWELELRERRRKWMAEGEQS